MLDKQVDTWWGSIVAGFGILPGVLVVAGANDLTKRLDDPTDDGNWLWLAALLAFVYLFYVVRGLAILVGASTWFDAAIEATRPALRWLFTFGVG